MTNDDPVRAAVEWSYPCRGDAWILWLLALAATVRVLFYGAAFPLFTNVDEFAHYDHVVRWSQGDVPRNFEYPTMEAANEYAALACPDYGWPTGLLPPERMPQAEREAFRTARVEEALVAKNHEHLQPPLYYALAGAWRAAWRGVGLPSEGLAYAVRGLNVLLLIVTVFVAGAVGRRVFPEDRFSRLAVPALVALMPQDAFYGINNDVLSPLLAGGVLLLVLRPERHERSDFILAAFAGLLTAAALMTKLSNIIVVATWGLAVLTRLLMSRGSGAWPRALRIAAVSALAAALPVLIWATWNFFTIIDPSGGHITAAVKGWTAKPVSTWLNHPLFTSNRAWSFLEEVVLTFWRGEFIWHGARVASPWADRIYLAVTITGLVGALGVVFRRNHAFFCSKGMAMIWSWLMLSAGVGFLVYISISWDFGPVWAYPSRSDPVLGSGRLIMAAMIPLCILLVAGLDVWARLVRFRYLRVIVLVALLGGATVSEFILTRPVLASPWNAIHLFQP